MKILLFISFFLIEICHAQLCIINDKDGYSNLRGKPNQNSKIAGKLVDGQAFAIDNYIQDDNQLKDWIAVKFPVKINKNAGYLKFEGEEKTAYIHKSRLITLEDLPHFEKNEINENKVIHHYKNIEITIETQAFKKSEHKIIQSKKGIYIIDGEKVFPYYGGVTQQIKNITIKSKNNDYSTPKSAFKNFMMVDANNSTVYLGQKGEMYVVLNAGDGADSYDIVFCIKDNKLFSVSTTSTIP